jgi:two-component system sensor histidine kinase/response regulator
MNHTELQHIPPDMGIFPLTEEQFNHSQRRLATVLGRRIRLLTNMSRNLRSNLNAIIGFSELLGDGDLSEEQKEYNRSIQEAGRMVLLQVTNVLEYLKMEQGKTGFKIQKCSLEELLEEIDSFGRQRAEKKGLQFKITRYDGFPAEIWTDTLHLRQCLLQLTENAIRTAEKENVSIKVYPELGDGNSYLRFDFEGSGQELNYEREKAIFEPFMETADNAGLLYDDGLWDLIITNQLVRLLGGRLSISNRGELGAVFSVLLPVKISCRQGPQAGDNKKARPARQVKQLEMKELLSDIAGAYGQIRRDLEAVEK